MRAAACSHLWGQTSPHSVLQSCTALSSPHPWPGSHWVRAPWRAAEGWFPYGTSGLQLMAASPTMSGGQRERALSCSPTASCGVSCAQPPGFWGGSLSQRVAGVLACPPHGRSSVAEEHAITANRVPQQLPATSFGMLTAPLSPGGLSRLCPAGSCGNDWAPGFAESPCRSSALRQRD